MEHDPNGWGHLPSRVPVMSLFRSPAQNILCSTSLVFARPARKNQVIPVAVTPVRDAIMRLESIGLVRVAPRRGVFVANCDRRTFKNVFELRIALECLAVDSAAHRIPEEDLRRAIETYREASMRLSRDGDSLQAPESEGQGRRSAA